jgi:hypothetical protein
MFKVSGCGLISNSRFVEMPGMWKTLTSFQHPFGKAKEKLFHIPTNLLLLEKNIKRE